MSGAGDREACVALAAEWWDTAFTVVYDVPGLHVAVAYGEARIKASTWAGLRVILRERCARRAAALLKAVERDGKEGGR